MQRKIGLAGAAVAAAAAAIGFAGSGSAATSPTAHASRATVLRLSADAHGRMRFSRSRITIGHGGRITFRMTNPRTSGDRHGIAIQGRRLDRDGRIVRPGRTSTLTVRVRKGRYTFFCPVPGHRALGMKGTLIVR